MEIYTQQGQLGIIWSAENDDVVIHVWSQMNGYVYKMKVFERRTQTNKYSSFDTLDEALEALSDELERRTKLVHLLRRKDAASKTWQKAAVMRLSRADLHYCGGIPSPSCALG